MQRSTHSATSGFLFKGEVFRHFSGSRMFAGFPQDRVRPAPQTSPWSQKWAVCTTIFKPSQPIMDMLQVEGWHVVVVGDRGAVPFNLTAQNLVYLDEAAQLDLGTHHPNLLKLLPWKHFGRKNLGFLYAVAHGAQMIWDFDDDNGLKRDVKEPRLPTSDVFGVGFSNECHAFNPYPLMGAPNVSVGAWPRGFPLELIRTPCKPLLFPSNTSRVAVLQSLADNEPDVDAIFRLTRDIPFHFDPNTRRTLILQRGTLAPYNAQATLVLQPAFFTQLLPITVGGLQEGSSSPKYAVASDNA